MAMAVLCNVRCKLGSLCTKMTTDLKYSSDSFHAMIVKKLEYIDTDELIQFTLHDRAGSANSILINILGVHILIGWLKKNLRSD